MARKPRTSRTVETLTHEEASRRNIRTAEYQSVMRKEQQDPVRVAYERRNRDLDPQPALILAARRTSASPFSSPTDRFPLAVWIAPSP